MDDVRVSEETAEEIRDLLAKVSQGLQLTPEDRDNAEVFRQLLDPIC